MQVEFQNSSQRGCSLAHTVLPKSSHAAHASAGAGCAQCRVSQDQGTTVLCPLRPLRPLRLPRQAWTDGCCNAPDHALPHALPSCSTCAVYYAVCHERVVPAWSKKQSSADLARAAAHSLRCASLSAMRCTTAHNWQQAAAICCAMLCCAMLDLRRSMPYQAQNLPCSLHLTARKPDCNACLHSLHIAILAGR